MNSNKDMQDDIMNQHSYVASNPRNRFDFQMRQQIEASQEECLKLIREMRTSGVLSGEPNPPLPACEYDPDTAYCRGYQNGYLDGFNKGMEHAANSIKNWADAQARVWLNGE